MFGNLIRLGSFSDEDILSEGDAMVRRLIGWSLKALNEGRFDDADAYEKAARFVSQRLDDTMGPGGAARSMSRALLNVLGKKIESFNPLMQGLGFLGAGEELTPYPIPIQTAAIFEQFPPFSRALMANVLLQDAVAALKKGFNRRTANSLQASMQEAMKTLYDTNAPEGERRMAGETLIEGKKFFEANRREIIAGFMPPKDPPKVDPENGGSRTWLY